MKKLLAIFLALLFLTGCGAGGEEDTSDTTEATEPQPIGLYDTESAIEQQTGGAVRAYPLEGNNYTGLASMGSKLLLITDAGELTVLNGELCEPIAAMAAGQSIDCGSTEFDTTPMGVAYYVEATREVVLLNPQLQENSRHTLPEEMQGKPAIDLENNEVFYCIGQEIRALNMQTGISRMIKSHSCKSQQLTGMYFDGKVLACQITNEQDESSTVYLSSETGQTLSTDAGLYDLKTGAQNYFALRMDGVVEQQIVGVLDGQAQSLNLTAENGALVPVLGLNGIVAYTAGEAGLQLSFYDLTSGMKTAAVTLSGVTEPKAFHTDGQHLWIIAGEGGKQVLYRWELSKSAVQEEAVYTGVLYTAQNPNTEGLNQLQDRVDALNQQHRVRIRIWEEAVEDTGDYAFEAEHQVSAISTLLDEVEAVLPLFPEKFLGKTVESGWVRICLVRGIDSGEPFAQYWEDGDCYIAIALGADVKEAILRGVAYGIDSHVIGNSRDYDTWDTLNPEGFAYDYDYNLNAQRDNAAAYLEGENRAFVDQLSMSFPQEDRARMLYYAMAEGSADYFTSPIMQAKLLRLCEGIREAYGLEKSAETYFWEQYLNQSLAYQK